MGVARGVGETDGLKQALRERGGPEFGGWPRQVGYLGGQRAFEELGDNLGVGAVRGSVVEDHCESGRVDSEVVFEEREVAGNMPGGQFVGSNRDN